MGSIFKRGPKFYLKYIESTGTQATRLARGATTTKEAKQLLNAAELRVSLGQVGIAPVVKQSPEERLRTTITIKQLGARFIAEYADPGLKDRDGYIADATSIIGQRIEPHLGHMLAAKLEAHDVETMRDKLTKEGYSGSSVTHALGTLSRMFTWARRKKLVDCSSNPVSGCRRPKSSRDRIDSADYLNADDVTKLLVHAEGLYSLPGATLLTRALYPMIAAGIFAGLRKGELLGLRWRDVDLDAKRIDVCRSYATSTKSDKPRDVPLHAELEVILRHWKESCPTTKEGLVFPQHGARMGRREDTFGLEKIMKDAECASVFAHPWHALRHTFASHFMMAGGNILTLQKLLGHADLKTTLVYAHLAADHKAAELARLTFKRSIANVVDLPDERRRRAAGNGYIAGTGPDNR